MSTARLPTDREVWRIAAPMILSNISVPLLGMVDTGVVGHLDGPAYLGAVAIGATIFTFIYTGMNFLRMGTTGIAAQAFGADDRSGVRASLGQALIVSLLIALSLIALQVPIGRFALAILGGEPATQGFAAEYFRIRIWSAPGTLANFAIIGWFIGLQNARAPLAIFLTINFVNIVLDLVFVLMLGMKVDGVALASVIAEYSGLVVGTVLVIRELRHHGDSWPLERLTNVAAYKAFFSVNGNIFIRTIALLTAFSFVTAWGARLGPLVLAANAVLMNFQMLASLGLDGIAHAAEALVGKAIGEKRRDALERAVNLTLKWSAIFAVGFTLAFLLGGKWIIVLLTDLEDVRATAYTYLPWLIVSPLISVWCFLYDGVFIGATRAKEMRNVMVVSLLLIFFPTWYLTTSFGNHGLWFAFTAFIASRGIGMHIIYRRKVLPSV
ncbi:MAG: MATE family efflux transporter [Pseudomonadota bacterium]